MRFVENNQIPIYGDNILFFCAANSYDVTTILFSAIKGLLFPDFFMSLNVLDSKIRQPNPNFSDSSCVHCFRREAGTIRRIFRRLSAHRCAMTKLASIVFPRPTSSARIAPRGTGGRSANRAASTWCGFICTRAVESDLAKASSSTPSSVTRCAKYML